ncbi:MAG TPA: orotidine-5'-phosphate decarboxylase [Candidatus Kapabacteria bacterium]|nr:orotidine-5'-phosphate decarboxylase [Candidatus Kapabacteria bacterium]
MTAYEKIALIETTNESKLCIGLDPQLSKLPAYLQGDLNGIYNFSCSIIDATSDLVSSYKINFAFFEQYGIRGIESLYKIIQYIPKNIFTIADAKRGDIGNSSAAYANAIFHEFKFDSITLSPYMGYDSLKPFLDYKDKISFILALTSNPSSSDFQRLIVEDEPLYLKVIRRFVSEESEEQIGFVAGATHPNDISEIRKVARNNYLLIPGIGTQGGDLENVLINNKKRNFIINVSRDIIYQSQENDFAEKARERAEYYRNMINDLQFRIISGKIS